MAVDGAGEKVWSREPDIYGKTKEETGKSNFVPFLYQGQYFDEETGLAYNRFRYYSPDSSTYISQDPIGLAGNNPNFYAYVFDSNTQIDPLGLDIIEVFRFDTRLPEEIKAGGGFNAKVPGSSVDLYDYALNNTPSQYISTSTDIDSVIRFGDDYYDGKGYIYRIEIDDGKGVDVNKILGSKSPFPTEKEFAVIDKISNNEIKGHTHRENISDRNNIKWNSH